MKCPFKFNDDEYPHDIIHDNNVCRLQYSKDGYRKCTGEDKCLIIQNKLKVDEWLGKMIERFG